MMSNPANAMRVLITYAICIPLAVTIGYLLTNPLDYGTLGFFGLVVFLIVSPVFIKWHYPIMIFGLGCPMYLFFLKGNPPLAQVVVMLSLGIAIVERTLNNQHRFIRIPSLTAPLLFIVGMTYFTAEMTGGIGLHALGGDLSGGKKYIAIFIGAATYFALTSRVIPKHHRNLYVGLFFLAGLPSFVSDLFPVLPSPLNYLNLFFPPSQAPGDNWTVGTTRLGAFATSASVFANFMLAKYGLRGIFLGNRLWRAPFFILMLILTMLGGFRISVISYMMIIFMLFFLERLHRTRLILFFVLGGTLFAGLLVPFSNQLPFTFQRALSFLPLKWDTSAVLAAEGSAQWRYHIWQDLWPKVPDYLLVGKGYGISQQDMTEMIGTGVFANGSAAHLDASQESLAISGDYHSGPLSTLIPFGVWGTIGILWLMAASLKVLYRNYKYGDLELRTVNTLLFVFTLQHIISFFFLFGAFQNDVGDFAKIVGFSIALNWGVRGPGPAPVPVQRIKPVRQPQPQLA